MKKLPFATFGLLGFTILQDVWRIVRHGWWVREEFVFYG